MGAERTGPPIEPVRRSTTHFLTQIHSKCSNVFLGRLSQGKVVCGRACVNKRAWVMLGVLGCAAVGCHGIDSKYSVGGTLTGVIGTGLVLQDDSGNDLGPLDVNGAFDFGGRLDNGDAYSVTVRTQPANPAQTCTVHNGSGTIDNADVTNIIVACTQTGRFAY